MRFRDGVRREREKEKEGKDEREGKGEGKKKERENWSVTSSPGRETENKVVEESDPS